MAAFFLSYRRQDAPDIVGRLHDRIVARFGQGSVFRDVDSIAVGVDFRLHIQAALASCRALVAVIGRGFLDRADPARPDYVVEEIAAALERSLPIFPVLVHGAEIPGPERLPERIRDLAFRQAARVRSDPDFGTDAEKLLQSLAKHNPEQSPDGQRPAVLLVSGPHKGSQFSIDKDRILIGRNARCDIRIDAAYSSQFHAAILATPRGLLCEDLGSTNGTYVNGLRVVGRVPLDNGDLILIGDSVFQIRTGPLAEGVGAIAEPVRVTVHVAAFARTNTVCCFINVTNRASSDVEVTHVWMDCTPPAFPDGSDRPLPKRLEPQESWETWIPLSNLPSRFEDDQLHRLGRVRLSTGAVVSSVRNDTVAARGSVPGGLIGRIP